MPFLSMNRRYRQLKRFREIAEVFLRHGFGYLIEQLDLHHILPWPHRVMPGDQDSLRPGSRGARLRQAMQELGPTFVKLGQVLSTRADLLPADITNELSLLQDRVEGVPFPAIRELVEAELGLPLEEAYQEFDPEPVAAASIGQVHRAVLPDGTEVAVKVRRPGIERIVAVDMDILRGVAALAEERFQPDFVRPREVVEEFARALRVEMNYLLEARNAEGFYRRYSRLPKIHIPKVFWSHTTEQVLTMEYIRGAKVSDLDTLERWGIDRVELAERGARFFLHQVLLEGFFHGDPHPGNLFVEPDGTLAVVDFGLVGRMDEDTTALLAELFMAIIGQDSERAVRALIRIGAAEGTVDRRALKADMEELIDRYYGRRLRHLELGEMISESFALARRHRVRLPTDFVLLGKAILSTESMGRLLYPDFNVVALAEPFVRELWWQRLSPGFVRRRLFRAAMDYGELLGGLPRKMDHVLTALETSQLEIRFRHRGLEGLIHRLDVVSNRLTAGIVIAALVIGSSLVIQSERGPLLWGLPVLGLIGFAFAALIGLWLVISILRSGRF